MTRLKKYLRRKFLDWLYGQSQKPIAEMNEAEICQHLSAVGAVCKRAMPPGASMVLLMVDAERGRVNVATNLAASVVPELLSTMVNDSRLVMFDAERN